MRKTHSNPKIESKAFSASALKPGKSKMKNINEENPFKSKIKPDLFVPKPNENRTGEEHK